MKNHEELSLGEDQARTKTDRRAEASKAAFQETRKAAAQRQHSVEGEANLHALAGSFFSFLFLPFVCLHMMLLDILQVASHVIF